MPSLTTLFIDNVQIGPQGATALASALTKRALPSLSKLSLPQQIDLVISVQRPTVHGTYSVRSGVYQAA